VFVPVRLPARLEPLLDEVRSLADVDFAAAGAEARVSWLAGLRQLVDATEVAFTRALAGFDHAGDHEVLFGALSANAWLRAGLHLAPGEASARVHLARRQDLLRPTLDAVRDGTLTYDQAAAVERSVRPLPAPAQSQAVELLTGLAAATDASAVRVAGRRLREVVDPDGALADHEQQFDRRHLTLSPLLDGMSSIDGVLDAEGAAVLRAALAPLMVPTGPDDDRTSAQRRADALVDVAVAALKSEQLPLLSGSATALDVVVPLAELQAGRGACLHADGGFLPGPALSRLACDTAVSRIVLGPGSVPLDVGRSVRLFSPHQRKALAARDGGCRFPGCSRPPRHTDVHHMVSWLHGGATDLANGLLLCRRHHRLVHEGGWGIRPDADGGGTHAALWFLGPRGQRLRGDPRAP
jgi:Domain of unknown function (DUF222)/HNH endonuclease